MKIIHCADLHLDSKLTGNLDRDRANERRSEILVTFSRMVEYAESSKVSAILIAGDMFDSNSVSRSASSIVSQLIINHPNIKFYYLRGNHDSGSFLSSLPEIPSNLCLFGKEWTCYNPGQDVFIYGIEADASNYSTAFLDIPHAAEDSFNIVILHGEVTNSSYPRSPEEIPLAAFRNKFFDYLALGHFHYFRKEALDARGIWCYSGCLEGRGFDEAGERGFVLIDTEKRTQTFVPFASRKYFDINVEVSDCRNSDDIAKFITRDLQNAGAGKDSLVKITLTGEIDESCDADLLYLLKIFDQYLYFIKIDNKTTLRIDIDSYRNDNSLKGEFIRLVEGDENLTGEEKSAIIRCGIKALKGEKIE